MEADAGSLGGPRPSASGSFSVAPVGAVPSAARRAAATVPVHAAAVAAAQATIATAVATIATVATVAAAVATVATAIATVATVAATVATVAAAQATVAAAPVGTAHAVVAVVAHGVRSDGSDGEQGVSVLSVTICTSSGPFIPTSMVGGAHHRAANHVFPTPGHRCPSRVSVLLDNGAGGPVRQTTVELSQRASDGATSL